MDHDNKSWWRQAVVYHVYPRSFADSDGDGIGDIPGVLSRIDYIATLGVDAIWLSPFYPSPLADGGYDISDHRSVDPRLGTLADVEELVRSLHARGIRLFVDIVPNHTSSEHPWFTAALASEPGSPERARFIFRDGRGPDGDTTPSDWPSHFGDSAWTRVVGSDGYPGQWYLHLFAAAQPDLNWAHEDVRADFLQTLRFWSDLGVDGFRVDVAHALTKDLTEPLRSKPRIVAFDNPDSGDDTLFDRNEVHEVYREWRRLFDTYTPPRVAVAEAYVKPSRRILYARPDELNQVFNFDLLNSPFEPNSYRRVISEHQEIADRTGIPSTWVLSNHDNVRHASRYGLPVGTDFDRWLMSGGADPALDVDAGLRRARAATLLILALPGSTYLYQGEELGLPEVTDIPTAELQDPIWIRSGGSVRGRDGARVPIPWSSTGSSLGFGVSAPHLPQPEVFAALSVEQQERDPASTLSVIRRALAARRELVSGEEFRWLPSSADVVAFDRGSGWVSFTNFGSQPVALPPGRLVAWSAAVDGSTLPAESTVWLVREPA